MSDRRLHLARAALQRAEKQWKGQVTCLPGGVDRIIRRAFGGVDLAHHISIGGIAPVGLHEIMCGHDDTAASVLAWYLARLSIGDQTGKSLFWVRQRRAIDQGGLYPLSLPETDMPVMMVVDQQATALWTCEEAAKSGQIASIIVETTDYDLTAARRLQLACEAGHTRLIAIRHMRSDGKTIASSAHTRWRITPDAPNATKHSTTGNRHILSLIGGRGVRPGSWRMQIDATTFSLSVADALENRLPPDRYAENRG